MDIVLIEDNMDHQELIIDILNSAYASDAKIKFFALLSEGLDYVKNHAVDLLLCDLKLPDSDIENTVEQLKNIKDAPAIIVLTSLSDETLAHQLVREGIQDYLPKGEINQPHLIRACNYAMERRRLNMSLINKTEDYKAFCYSLTHDFKSSLWQIARFAQIFRKEADKAYPDDKQLPFEFLDKIFEKVENIQTLVNDLQDYLSLDVSHHSLTKVSLNHALSQAIDNLEDSITHRNAKLELDELPEINGNLTQLQLLFTNLIGNAIKYNDKEFAKIIVSLDSQHEQYYIVQIIDNGIGIPEKDLDSIFVPFERGYSKDIYPGTGLGLSIVKRVMQYHEGRIKVASTLGEGSTFTLFFPKRHTEQ